MKTSAEFARESGALDGKDVAEKNKIILSYEEYASQFKQELPTVEEIENVITQKRAMTDYDFWHKSEKQKNIELAEAILELIKSKK